MKKTGRIFSIIFLCMMIMMGTIMDVYATTDFIQIGSSTETKSYVANTTIPYKVTTTGKYLYSTTSKLNVPRNVKAYLVNNSRYVDGGSVYILQNGYPAKTITGDVGKDYYITQAALWWYYDLTTGTTNLSESFKSSGTDTYGMRKTIKDLAYAGYNNRKNKITNETPNLKLEAVGGSDMTLNDNYYVSNPIKATKANGISNYTVSVTNAPSGTKIVSSNGVETVYTKSFTVKADDTFKIKVPVSNLLGTTQSIKISATAQGTSQVTVEEYKANDTSLQSVLFPEVSTKNLSSSFELTITSSKVTISVVDSATKKTISGAKFVLKNSYGAIIANWTSTLNSHVIHNLSNGTYTIEEREAPNGYKSSSNTTFTISNTNRDVKVTVENTPIKSVVSIVTVDQETNEPLAGAVMVIKKSDGTEVARYTSTKDAYIISDLPVGSYDIYQISPPSGYAQNNNFKTFTIDQNHVSHQLTYPNVKAVPVPDTASTPSIMIAIVGAIILGIGYRYIKKNAKQF